MTTYATTYGWRSTGVRRDLMTSSPKENPVNEGLGGPTGVHGTADSITTNREGRRFESCRARLISLQKRRKARRLGTIAGSLVSENIIHRIHRKPAFRKCI